MILYARASKSGQIERGAAGDLFGPRIFSVAVILGAVAVERHITLDRSMYGSDQAASLEPSENSAGPTCVWVALMVSKRAVAQSLKTIASRLTPFPIFTAVLTGQQARWFGASV